MWTKHLIFACSGKDINTRVFHSEVPYDGSVDGLGLPDWFFEVRKLGEDYYDHFLVDEKNDILMWNADLYLIPWSVSWDLYRYDYDKLIEDFLAWSKETYPGEFEQ